MIQELLQQKLLSKLLHSDLEVLKLILILVPLKENSFLIAPSMNLLYVLGIFFAKFENNTKEGVSEFVCVVLNNLWTIAVWSTGSANYEIRS